MTFLPLIHPSCCSSDPLSRRSSISGATLSSVGMKGTWNGINLVEIPSVSRNVPLNPKYDQYALNYHSIGANTRGA